MRDTRQHIDSETIDVLHTDSGLTRDRFDAIQHLTEAILARGYSGSAVQVQPGEPGVITEFSFDPDRKAYCGPGYGLAISRDTRWCLLYVTTQDTSPQQCEQLEAVLDKMLQ